MTSHCDSHTTTDIKPEIIPGVQTGNGIPHARTNIKDNIFRQRRLDIDEAHMELDIFCSRCHNIGINRAGILAWFPDYGHLMAGIF